MSQTSPKTRSGPPRVRTSQSQDLPGSGPPRVRTSQGQDLTGSGPPRVRTSQDQDLPGSGPPRIRTSQGQDLPGSGPPEDRASQGQGLPGRLPHQNSDVLPASEIQKQRRQVESRGRLSLSFAQRKKVANKLCARDHKVTQLFFKNSTFREFDNETAVYINFGTGFYSELQKIENVENTKYW